MKKEWFAEWFDSPYYHTLYKDRDEKEAQTFIEKLSQEIQLPRGSHVLDLACGKGRHSITLNKLGYSVIGADLSPNSIAYAKQFENESLKFRVHDMRFPIENEQFDAIFNLFTSFGYFDTLEENSKVIAAVKVMLKPKGLFVIDFMNSEKVLHDLVPSEQKIVDGVQFNITRSYVDGKILKNIRFEAENRELSYTEKVQAIRFNDFKQLLTLHHFEIIHTFGNFSLNPFDLKNSNRLIIIAQSN